MDWYAATWGSASGTGAKGDPYDLPTLLGTGSPVSPGDDIYIFEGTYVPLEAPLAGGFGTADTAGKGVYNLRINGTAANPITIRPIKGHVVRINGGIHILSTYSSYINVFGLRIGPTPTTRDWSGNPGGVDFPACLRITSPGVKVSGCYLFDGSEALTIFGTTFCYIEGNVCFNNGWWATANPGDYNVYTHNDTTTGNGVEFYRNIFCVPYGTYNFHAYSGSNNVRGYTLSENFFTGKPNRYLPPSAKDADFDVSDNELYGLYHYVGAGNTDYTIDFALDGDYIIADREWTGSHYTMYINRVKTLSVTNTTQGSHGSLTTRLPYYWAPVSPTSEAWDNTSYLQLTSLTLAYLYGSGPTSYNFANWKTATGFDASSSETTTPPATNRVRVYANSLADDEMALKGIFCVWNWANSSTQSVNMSPLGLTLNQTYRVRQATNPFVEYFEFVYDGSSVSVPLDGWTSSVPAGDTNPILAHPGNFFTMFVVEEVQMPFYSYIQINGTKYATTRTWKPVLVKPVTLRLMMDANLDAAYGPGALREWKGRVKADNTPASGYGSPSTLRTALDAMTSITFVDHYGDSHTVHTGGYEEDSLLPDWDSADNSVYFDLSLKGT